MVFITSYEKDYVTSNLHSWAKEINKFSKDKGINPTHFYNNKATKRNIEKYLSKKNPSFVFLNGHGSEKHICGHNNEPIFLVNNNEHLLKDKVVYIVACDCGLKLSSSIFKKGNATAVISYKKKFCMPLIEGRECTPLKNVILNSIKETSNVIPKSLIKGKTVSESIKSSYIKGYKWMKILQNQDPLIKAETLIWVLYHNLKSLSIDGNSNASLSY